MYEDVAIATYLLVLWELEREEKNLKSLQSFVDLGCGNGLLVHILNSEGVSNNNNSGFLYAFSVHFRHSVLLKALEQPCQTGLLTRFIWAHFHGSAYDKQIIGTY